VNPLNKYLQSFYRGVIDFAAPRYCLVCGELIESKKADNPYLCLKCEDSIAYAPDSRVILARIRDSFGSENTFVDRANSLIYLKENSGVMELIYNMKYGGIRNIGTVLGKKLGKVLIKENNTDYDLIHPVPIHFVRQRERGFNQSFYIAKGISEVINVPIYTKNLFRTEYTQTQTMLNHKERATNMLNKFDSVKSLQKQKLLLVDDVITTGATINNCAKSAKAAGASIVGAASLVLA
jgi:ComF family protein